MQLRQSVDRLERDYLRAVYEMAGGKAKRAVSYGEVRVELGHSEDEADRACSFWADCGMLEWTALGHIALTHRGLRRAEDLAQSGWKCVPPPREAPAERGPRVAAARTS